MQKEKPYIHLFKTPGGYFIYDVNTNAIIKIQESIYNFLEDDQKNNINNESKYDNNEYKKIIDSITKLKEKGFLSTKRVKELIHTSSSTLEYILGNKLRMIILQVTQQCNLRCEYCAYSDKYLNRVHANERMDFDTAKKGIEFLIDHSKDVDQVHISFYGGEPLLEFDLLKKCINYAIEIGEGKKVTFGLTTNATLFTKEMIEFFEQHDVNIMISLDGPKEIHDENRKFSVSNKGSFDKILSNLEFFKTNYPEYFKKVSFNIVMDKKNDFDYINEFFNTCEMIKDNMVNMSAISSNYAKFENNSSEDFDTKLQYELFKLYLNKVNRLDVKHVSKLLANEYDMLIKKTIEERELTRSLPDKTHHSGPCIPGAVRLFVDVHRNLFPCERVSETSKVMKIGHLDTGFDIEQVDTLLNIGKITENKCLNCWAFRFCTLCAASADDTNELSSDIKLSNCYKVRVGQEQFFRNYCTLIDLGHSFEDDNNRYFLMEDLNE